MKKLLSEGLLEFEKEPKLSVIAKLRELEGTENHWRVSKNCKGIEWDGSTELGRFIEGLEEIIEMLGKEVILKGEVRYRDVENIAVSGGVRVTGNKIEEIIDEGVVSDTELKEFRKFCYRWRRADLLLADWMEHKKNVGAGKKEEKKAIMT